MIGSCFAESMARRMRRQLFTVESNPFGPLYNPASIERILSRVADNRQFEESEMFCREGSYYCFDSHTLILAASARELTDELNSRLANLRESLCQAGHLFITLGTARTYRRKTTGQIVSNCHKMPATDFECEMLSVNAAASSLTMAIKKVRQLNPNISVWLTVSPIRHLADGAEGNQLSKSTLLLACDEVRKNTDYSSTGYFPSYEIVMDDLRDYRFYADDMVHPSEQAADYIYERFSETFYSTSTMDEARKFEKIVRRLLHRPMTKNPDTLRIFNQTTKEIITRLQAEHPYLSKAIGQLNIEQ